MKKVIGGVAIAATLGGGAVGTAKILDSGTGPNGAGGGVPVAAPLVPGQDSPAPPGGLSGPLPPGGDIGPTTPGGLSGPLPPGGDIGPTPPEGGQTPVAPVASSSTTTSSPSTSTSTSTSTTTSTSTSTTTSTSTSTTTTTLAPLAILVREETYPCYLVENGGPFFYAVFDTQPTAVPGATAFMVMNNGESNGSPDEAVVQDDGRLYFLVYGVEQGWTLTVVSMVVDGAAYSTDFGAYLLGESDC